MGLSSVPVTGFRYDKLFTGLHHGVQSIQTLEASLKILVRVREISVRHFLFSSV